MATRPPRLHEQVVLGGAGGRADRGRAGGAGAGAGGGAAGAPVGAGGGGCVVGVVVGGGVVWVGGCFFFSWDHLVDAGAGPGGYSTVTDFARLRGWSTSRPFAVASAIAKICSGTTASSGESSVGDSGIQKISSA